jgi:Zn-dependent M28 family amino/carboxypeptidase
MVRKTLTAAFAAMAASLLLVPAASAIDTVDTSELRENVTLEGVLEHARALQLIAPGNDDNRAATTPGYDASVAYVAQRLRAAGYQVRRHGFDFPQWTKNGPATLEELSPTARTFVEDTDYIVSQFAASGDLEAQVVPTNDIEIPPSGGPGAGTSGCEPEDFPAETAGNIALMQRGTCPFVQKYQMAKDAGAVAALIFNDGFEGRTAPLFITSPPDIGIPTIMTSSAVGESLYNEAQSGPVTLHIVVDATTTPNREINVIANSPGGNSNRVITLGAHLDSVEAGPGINDNGSGVAGILEIAEEVAELDTPPRNKLRFAFWGAEEAGLVGSTAYVNDLVEGDRIDNIEANLNFDMIGSPNFVRFVYDGDLSDSAPPPGGAPNGSGQIEQMFLNYFEDQGLETEPTAFDGRSDYGPFIANGVPAGGLFTGAEGIKTPAQAATYGGFAGMQYDPNYHEEGDTFFNLDHTVLDQNSDAAAHAAWTLARSQSAITDAQPQASKLRKAKRGKRVKHWKYIGPFRVR